MSMTESGSLKLKYMEEQYETLTFLGRSSSKKVYLCKDKRNGRIVVKKYVAPNTCAVYEKLREISDIHMARTYETAFDDRTGLVIEEFINGTTLREYLHTYGRPNAETVCRIVRDLCDALSKPHSLGIIHRDINLDNIMISNDGVLKIIDFGIARILKDQKPQDTNFLGTAGYAPPEQFGFAQTDVRTDIYSIGMVMGELLLGELPPADLLRKQSYNFHNLGAIIRKCIEMDPERRFQTVSELRQAIQKIYALPSGSKTVKKTSDGAVVSWLPGFRTGKLWKNILATLGYLFLLLSTLIMITGENYISSVHTFLLESLAIFLYIWTLPLIAFNLGNWDKKLYPFRKFPRPVMVIIRIFLWIFLFYEGILLENYVRYTLMGLTRTP